MTYRIKPLFLVQELSQILWGCTQHALLLKVLDPSLWFLVEPVKTKQRAAANAVSQKQQD